MPLKTGALLCRSLCVLQLSPGSSQLGGRECSKRFADVVEMEQVVKAGSWQEARICILLETWEAIREVAEALGPNASRLLRHSYIHQFLEMTNLTTLSLQPHSHSTASTRVRQGLAFIHLN